MEILARLFFLLIIRTFILVWCAVFQFGRGGREICAAFIKFTFFLFFLPFHNRGWDKMTRQEIEMSLLHDTRRLVRFRKPRIRFARIHVDRFQSRRSETLPVKGLWQDLEIPQASLRSMSSVHPKRIYKFTSFHDFRLLFSKLIIDKWSRTVNRFEFSNCIRNYRCYSHCQSSSRGEKELRNIISTRERGQKGFNRGCAWSN